MCKFVRNTTSSTISVTPYNGFDQPVTLTAASITDAYGNTPPGLTATFASGSGSSGSTTVPTGDSWSATLTIAAASASGSTPSCPAGTYYVTVQAAGGGYTDSVIIEVTVSAPNVTVTSPGNGSVLMAGCTTNVSASADANGTSIGTIDYPLTEGEPTTFTWTVVSGANVFTAAAVYGAGAGEVSVTSVPVTATGGSVTVPNTDWNPDPVSVGVWINGTENATCDLDGGGSGATFATYSWTTTEIMMSPTDPPAAFTDVSADAQVVCLYPTASTPYDAMFNMGGFYYAQVSCGATIYSSVTGASIASISGNGLIGSAAPPSGSDNPDVMLRNAAREDAHDGTGAVAEEANAMKIQIAVGGQPPVDADALPSPVIIGEDVKLSVTNLPQGAKCAWTINGSTFASENPGEDSNGVVYLSSDDLQSATPEFYWWAPGQNSVSVKVTDTALAGPLPETVNVVGPSATIVIDGNGTMQPTEVTKLNKNGLLWEMQPAHGSNGQPLPPDKDNQVQGIRLDASIGVPPGLPSSPDFSGSHYAWTQIANWTSKIVGAEGRGKTSKMQTFDGSRQGLDLADSPVDGFFDDQPSFEFQPASFRVTAPGGSKYRNTREVTLTKATYFQPDYKFITTLEYKPGSSKAVYVPVAFVTWEISGTYDDGNFTPNVLQPSLNPGPITIPWWNNDNLISWSQE